MINYKFKLSIIDGLKKIFFITYCIYIHIYNYIKCLNLIYFMNKSIILLIKIRDIILLQILIIIKIVG